MRMSTFPAIPSNGAFARQRTAASVVLVLAMLACASIAIRFDDDTFSATIAIASLAAGTLLSEDLTCIAAGQLVARGTLTPAVAVFGCAAGIYLGDLGLWLLGRAIGRHLIQWPWLARRLPAAKLERFRIWFDRHAGQAVIAARFLPGTRLPLYIAAGTLGRRGRAFAGWTLVAALLWTPLLIGLVARFGDAFAGALQRSLGRAGAIATTSIATFAVVRVLPRFGSRSARLRLFASMSRLWRWEFWPACLFYAPAAVWIALLSIRRGGFRGFSSITAANPGIPHGGFVGESKFQILSSLAPLHVAPTALIDSGSVERRLDRFDALIRSNAWDFPLILKPDVGHRGAGVKLARSREVVAAYLARHPERLIIQVYHPGPFEAGVFYCGMPDEPTGRIFSITDKHFPEVIGDGRRTLEQLVWDHPRYRMQAGTFLKRHAQHADRVLADGERVRLADAGNHCQGTMFRDGAHLITPELERAIDTVARRFAGGFYFGRFDVRYADVAAFMRGEDFTIIELNGVTSESTNLYDPSGSLLRAYHILFGQWSMLFRIADRNIRRGVTPTAPLDLLNVVVGYYRTRETPAPGE
jgi:membrane protein DedA with SNARE-associated domain